MTEVSISFSSFSISKIRHKFQKKKIPKEKSKNPYTNPKTSKTPIQIFKNPNSLYKFKKKISTYPHRFRSSSTINTVIFVIFVIDKLTQIFYSSFGGLFALNVIPRMAFIASYPS